MLTQDSASMLLSHTKVDESTGMSYNHATGSYFMPRVGHYIMDDHGNSRPMCIHLLGQNDVSLSLDTEIRGQYWVM